MTTLLPSSIRTAWPVAVLGMAMAAIPGHAAAQPPVAAAQAEPDPARLAAAKRFVDLIMPPAERESMIRTMLTPMMANMRNTLTQSPMFAAIGDSERKRTVLDQFLARQNDRSMALLSEMLPGLMEVMARAYARRFTLDQFADLQRFFETPSGRAYITIAPAVMGDPDILGWQRSMMTRSIEGMPAEMERLTRDLADRASKGGKAR